MKHEPSHRKAGTLGALLYRAGSYKEAVDQLTEAVRTHGEGGDGWTCLFLAMAHHRLKHDEEARRWLARATAAREDLEKSRRLKADRDAVENLVGPTTAALDVPLLNLIAWWEWAELELLWPEAEALLGTRPAGGK